MWTLTGKSWEKVGGLLFALKETHLSTSKEAH